MRWLLLLPLLLLSCGEASPEELPTERTERGTFRVKIELEGAMLRRGRNAFTARAWDDTGRIARLRSVIARMPTHDHEAVTATVRWDGAVARVDDLVLTMPGRWEITLHFEEGTRGDAVVWWIWLP